MSQGAAPPGRVVTSAANPGVKAAIALRDRRERDRTGLTLIDGARELRRALDAGMIVTDAFLCEPLLAGGDARAVLDRLAVAGTDLPRSVRPSSPSSPSVSVPMGSWRSCAIPSLDLVDLTLPADPLVVVIEGVEKPGNVGAVLRSADGAGVDAADPRRRPDRPVQPECDPGQCRDHLQRAAGGRHNRRRRAWLRARGLRIVAARPDADRLYTEIDLTGSVAIALGTESDGLTSALGRRRR